MRPSDLEINGNEGNWNGGKLLNPRGETGTEPATSSLAASHGRPQSSGSFTCCATACSDSLENSVVSTRGKTRLRDGIFHDAFAVSAEDAILSDMAWTHLRVAVDVFIEKTPELRIACRDNPVPDNLGRFRRPAAGEVFLRNRGNVDLDIDAVHQGPEILDI